MLCFYLIRLLLNYRIMKWTANVKTILIQLVCYLFALLFVYAAVSKMLDFENFQVELGQSPLLSAFAEWISWSIVAIELAAAFMLAIPKSQKAGLYAAFVLMGMFTAYIYVILNFSSFVPCSCGGILGKMGWQGHLIFNIFCMLLASLGLLLDVSGSFGIKHTLVKLLLLCSLSMGAVYILFLSSEEIMEHKNPFIRRYPHHPVTLIQTVDLKYNSYYLAGYGNGRLYLGNSTVPLSLLIIDSSFQKESVKISLDRGRFSFRSYKIAVRPPSFYIIDGGVPAVFTGNIADWKAGLVQPSPPYFNAGVPMGGSSIAFRGNSAATDENVLGIFRYGKHSNTVMAPELLEKQIDGVFDTDGMLHYSAEMKRIIYLYTYRNQYIVADEDGKLEFRGHTIDTTSRAKIKVAYLNGKMERAMSAPAVNVNKTSSVYGHLLFVNSNVQGRYEQKMVWKQASVIDVYDLNERAYKFSFHIYGINGRKLRSFTVAPSKIYALIDDKLVIYKINGGLQKEMKSAPEVKN